MRLFGHPLHALLVAFPIGLLALTPLWDALSWLMNSNELALVAYHCELAGLIAASVAALPGFIDLVKLSEGARSRTGARHALIMLAAASLFGVAFAFRSRAQIPGALVCSLDALAALTLAVGAWFGGELIFRHGVGVRARPGDLTD
jgi:uncharacterized membrane protein